MEVLVTGRRQIMGGNSLSLAHRSMEPVMIGDKALSLGIIKRTLPVAAVVTLVIITREEWVVGRVTTDHKGMSRRILVLQIPSSREVKEVEVVSTMDKGVILFLIGRTNFMEIILVLMVLVSVTAPD